MADWSKKYGDHCLKCGTTEIRHHSKGLCKRCYQQKYHQSDRGKEVLQKASKKYNQTPHGKEQKRKLQQEFRQTIKGRKIQHRGNHKYQQTSKGKEVHRRTEQKRRAIKKGVNYWLCTMDIEWIRIKIDTMGQCPICKEWAGINAMTMDHIIPISKGGIHHIWNVQPMCKNCNCRKSNRMEM